MKTDFLIIGQGIAGTLLSFRLLLAGKSVIVMDDGSSGRASRVAGAVINPLSGKNWTRAADADLFVPVALECYRELEELLVCPLLRQLPLYIFDAGDHPQLPALEDPAFLNTAFRAPDQVYCNEETWIVDAAALLDNWKEYLLQQGRLKQEMYAAEHCRIEAQGIKYKDIAAETIVFCEGSAANRNELFHSLPFTRNRGEALLLDIPGLPAEAIYHGPVRLVPRPDGLFWCGSNYKWNYDSLEPDEDWHQKTVAELEAWLRLPFTVKDHIVAERPTTAGQVPLVGVHPYRQNIALLNGLGTRGFSSGPFWASELAKKLTDRNYRIRNYNEDWLRRKFG